MKDIKELLYGKSSKEQMDKFSKAIADLNEKFDLEKDDKIENHITINCREKNLSKKFKEFKNTIY